MAYKPKFSAPRTGERAVPRQQPEQRQTPPRGTAPEQKQGAGKAAAPERKSTPRPVEQRTPPTPQKKKPSKAVIALFVVLGIVIIPASLFFSGKLLNFIVTNVARPGISARTTVVSMELGKSLEGYVSAWEQEQKTAMGVAEAGNSPEETNPVETAPKTLKRYPIADDVLVAPKPDASKYGESDDPQVLRAVLASAQWLLDGQSTYFDPDRELRPGSTVRYYLDDSIFAIAWKEVHDESVYSFAEVKISDPSQFRLHLADGIYGSDSLYTTTEMSESVNAVVAAGAYFYKQRTFGAMVYQGIARKVDGLYSQTCFIDRNGDMSFVRAGELLSSDAAQKYANEHDIWFSICFGPILVDDYQLEQVDRYGVGEIDWHYTRAALCQMDTLHYLVANACEEPADYVAATYSTPNLPTYSKVPTVAEFAKRIQETGCRYAYSLDGGQTATIAMDNTLVNRPVYGQQRSISDIIYFATGVTEGG